MSAALDRGVPHDRAGEVLADLIAFPTVTSASNLELIDYAAGVLTDVGARLRLTYDDTRTKANLFATVGPEVDGGVVLSGHTDVVPADAPRWRSPPFAASRRGDRIHGRGAADTKGFIAAALTMAPRLAATDLALPLHVALTFDEEVGCRGAPILIADLMAGGIRPGAAIVGEPTTMRPVRAHKGCYEYTTTITGVAGHGSAPHKAVNAIDYAARYATRLAELHRRFTDRPAPVAGDAGGFDPPHSTISIGAIRGGTAHNVVAGECHLDWEFRPVDDRDRDHLEEELARFERELRSELRRRDAAADLSTRRIGAVDGLVDDPDSPAVALVTGLLDDPVTQLASFGTEAGLYQRAGIPAVVCGPGSIDVAHRPDEFVEVEQLDRCLAMFARLGRYLCDPDHRRPRPAY